MLGPMLRDINVLTLTNPAATQRACSKTSTVATHPGEVPVLLKAVVRLDIPARSLQ